MIGGERAAGRRVHGRHQWPDLHLRLRRALAGGLGRHGRHRALQRGGRPAQADRDRDPGPDGDIKFIARAKVGGMELEWEDLPCNWVREHWFEHRRRSATARSPCWTRAAGPDPHAEAATATTAWKRRRAGCWRGILAGGFLRSAERHVPGPGGSRPTGSRGASRRSRSCRRRCRLPGPPSAPRDAGPAAGGRPLGPRPRRASGRRGRRGAGGRCRADQAAAARPALGRAGAARDRSLPRGHPAGHAGAALGPALPALPWRQGDRGHARPDPDRRPLRHLQHRLCPQLLAQRRADLAPVSPRSGRSRAASSACSGR